MVVDQKIARPSVLIIGSPRSGTTWLAKLFDSNEHVLYRHEPDSVVHDARLPFVPDGESIKELQPVAKQYLEVLGGVCHIKASGSLPAFPKVYRSKLSDRLRQGVIILSKACDTVLRRAGFRVEFRIPDMIRPEQMDKVVVVMKSVSSLARANVFSSADPELKIIHIIRHPCAFVASELRGKRLKLMKVETFLDDQAEMSQAKKRGLNLSFLESLSLEEQLASLWMLQNEKVMEEMAGRPNYKLIVYETLCEQTKEALEELFNFSGLRITDQTREFIRHSQSGGGESEKYFQVVRDSKKASQKWRDELDSNQIQKIMKLAGDSTPGRLFDR